MSAEREQSADVVRLTYPEKRALREADVSPAGDGVDDGMFDVVERIVAERLRALAAASEAWEWTAPVGPGNASYANGYENGRRAFGTTLRGLLDPDCSPVQSPGGAA